MAKPIEARAADVRPLAAVQLPALSASAVEPFACSPAQAQQILAIGHSRLFELIKSGELETYVDGRSRKITMRSIKARLERLLAEAR
jgi:hypothetical protein